MQDILGTEGCASETSRGQEENVSMQDILRTEGCASETSRGLFSSPVQLSGELLSYPQRQRPRAQKL